MSAPRRRLLVYVSEAKLRYPRPGLLSISTKLLGTDRSAVNRSRSGTGEALSREGVLALVDG